MCYRLNFKQQIFVQGSFFTPLVVVFLIVIVTTLIFNTRDAYRKEKTVIGVLKVGLNTNEPITYTYLDTSEKAYYLIENSYLQYQQPQKTLPQYCIEYRASCFVGKRLRVKGYMTGNHIKLSNFDTKASAKIFEATELEVIKFEVVN